MLYGIVIYRPTKCTSVKRIFQFLRFLLYVSNPRVNLQEDVCTYRYGIICLHVSGISSLVGGRVLNKCAFSWLILYDYIIMHDAEIIKKNDVQDVNAPGRRHKMSHYS